MNNNHSNQSKGPGFINGFLWGAIIGAGVVFLLGTKKGKNILKVISEEGLELSELFSEEVQEDEQPKKEEHHKCKECQTEEKETAPSNSQNGALAKIAHSGRRFFRGTHKGS